jgi:hypothetical protein
MKLKKPLSNCRNVVSNQKPAGSHAACNMKKSILIWLILLAATICVCCQPAPRYAARARIKVENNGGILNGFNNPTAKAYPYDSYFIMENHIQISDARMLLE